jgi:hypothetical protein
MYLSCHPLNNQLTTLLQVSAAIYLLVGGLGNAQVSDGPIWRTSGTAWEGKLGEFSSDRGIHVWCDPKDHSPRVNIVVSFIASILYSFPLFLTIPYQDLCCFPART